MSDAMEKAIAETNRRRAIQVAHNEKNGIVPTSIMKEVRDLTERVKMSSEADASGARPADMPRAEMDRMVKELEVQMKQAAQNLEFEKAALLRDQIIELRELMALKAAKLESAPIWEQDRVLVGIADEEPEI